MKRQHRIRQRLLEVVIRKVQFQWGQVCREPVPNFGGFVQGQRRECLLRGDQACLPWLPLCH